MHITDQVFLRKKYGLYIEKANQCPVFSLHAIQLNTFTWSEAVTKLKYCQHKPGHSSHIICSVCSRYEKNKQPIFSIISYLLHVIRQYFRAECVKMIANTSNVTVMLKKIKDYNFYVKIMPQVVIIQSSMSQPLKLMPCGPVKNKERV